MPFGENPTYLYGEVFKSKFSTPEKAYKIDEISFECSGCPAKLVGDKLEIFFSGPIFNTLVESVEEKVTILRSYDGKRTIIKQRMEEHKLYTVVTIRETPQLREVELYKFDTLFPGYRTTAQIELKDGKPQACTPVGTGPIHFQSNDRPTETDCLLYKIENAKCSFVEINHPIKRCRVTVVKDLRTNKLVENGAIRGILLGCDSSVAEGQAIDVFVHRVCLGRYVFVEDIKPGPATVDLVKPGSGGHKVTYRGFTGVCYDKKVNKKMKGVITEVNGDTFVFERDRDSGRESADTPEKRRASAEEQIDSEKAPKKTQEFEQVDIFKRAHINDDDDVGLDQYRAIELIKEKLKEKTNVFPLFKKYMMLLKKKDDLCLFYLKYLEESDRLDKAEVNRVLQTASEAFPRKAAEHLQNQMVLERLFKKKKSKSCFMKLLDLVEDKAAFAKQHKEFIGAAVEYFYKNGGKPRQTVDEIVGKSFDGWMAYLKNEHGPYKRGLFRRLVTDAFLKKSEMKQVLEKWLEFEEKNGGDVEEVKRMAKSYIESNDEKQ